MDHAKCDDEPAFSDKQWAWLEISWLSFGISHLQQLQNSFHNSASNIFHIALYFCSILVMINNNQECILNHTMRVKSPLYREYACILQSGYIIMHNHTTSLPPIIQQLLTNNIHYKYYTYVVTVCQHFMMCIGLDNAEYGVDFFEVVLVLPRQ